MVQKSDNEFVKSRIELHCIVPFANTIIPDSRKKKTTLAHKNFSKFTDDERIAVYRWDRNKRLSACGALSIARAACIWPDTQNPPWRFSQGGFFHVIASSTHAITCGGS